ncbi:MAG: TldD/PmbA family protein [Candidatus Hydrothermales bacterium]
MREIINEALNAFEILKVSYGEIRIVDKESEIIFLKNGIVENFSKSEDRGYGIRIFENGGMGFAASNDFSKDKIFETVKKAKKLCEASYRYSSFEYKLSQEKVSKGTYKSNIVIDPFEVSVEEKLNFMREIDERLKSSKYHILRNVVLAFFKEKKYFASTEGHDIYQEIYHSGGGYSVYTFKDGILQVRSYPESHGGNYLQGGFEVIDKKDFLEKAYVISEEADKLLFAKPAPAGVFDLIIMPGQMVLQIHESVGHATELDRVLGYEASYAGTSFLTLDSLFNFKYASEIVNIVADATYPRGLGTFGYDDEGTPAKRVYLIKNGILSGFLSSRDTSIHINSESSGCARASSWNRIPIVRMTNINLEPQEKDLEELISDIKEGFLIDVNKSWSIDEKRLNFQFVCEIGYKIENGKLTGEIVRDPLYYGITPEFWNSCDGIGKNQVLYGLLNCGKGEPGQTMHVGHASPPARFRKVNFGSGSIK